MPVLGPFIYTAPIDFSVVNDGMAEYVARRPDRFAALGSGPMTDERRQPSFNVQCAILG
jgi:hypothetical protein